MRHSARRGSLSSYTPERPASFKTDGCAAVSKTLCDPSFLRLFFRSPHSCSCSRPHAADLFTMPILPSMLIARFTSLVTAPLALAATPSATPGCSYTCADMDRGGYALRTSASGVNNGVLHCDYPTTSSAATNVYYCEYNPSTGVLTKAHDVRYLHVPTPLRLLKSIIRSTTPILAQKLQQTACTTARIAFASAPAAGVTRTRTTSPPCSPNKPRQLRRLTLPTTQIAYSAAMTMISFTQHLAKSCLKLPRAQRKTARWRNTARTTELQVVSRRLRRLRSHYRPRTCACAGCIGWRVSPNEIRGHIAAYIISAGPRSIHANASFLLYAVYYFVLTNGISSAA